MFEAWKKKQGETISNKLREFFSKVEIKLISSKKLALQKWRSQVMLDRNQNLIEKQQNQIIQLQKELQFEKEESLQYQKKLQARHSKQKSKEQQQESDHPYYQQKDRKLQDHNSSQLGLLSPIKNCGVQHQLSPKDLQDSMMLGVIDKSSHYMSTTELDAERLSSMFKKNYDDFRHKVGESKIGQSKPVSPPRQNVSNFEMTDTFKQDDRLKSILERFMKDKYSVENGSFSKHQQRELEYLVDFVKKMQGETSECTFHPQLNPKSIKILNNNPTYQMTAKQIFEKLHLEGYSKQMNFAKWLEIKEEQEMQECTFSPRTNSPQDRKFSPQNAFQRLHYDDLGSRQEKLSKKEAEKTQKFKQDYTFRPERSKTKKKESQLLKDKENSIYENKYDRLYKGYLEKAEKLEGKRQAQLQEEKAMMSPSFVTRQGRSKSQKKQNQTMEMQTLSAQLSSFFPSSTMNQRNNTILFANQKALGTSKHVNSQNSLQRKGHSTLENITNLSSPSAAFNRLYQNAEQTRKKKSKLRETIDQEAGISFSPKLFKSPSRLTNCSSTQMTVIERNEQFEKNKLQKRLEKEELKYIDCTFEPTLVTKRSKVNESQTNASEVGERLYQNALKQEEKKSRKRLELEQQMKLKYLKKRHL